MSLVNLLGENPPPTNKVKKALSVQPEEPSPVEETPICGITIKKVLKYINKYGARSELHKSAVMTLLHGYSRPLYKNRCKPYLYRERFLSRGGKYYLRDRANKLISVDRLVAKKRVAEFKNLIENNILPSHGREVKYTIIRTNEEMEEALKSFANLDRPISMDIETSGLDPYTSKICGMGLASSGASGVYFPLAHVHNPDIAPLLTADPEDANYTAPDIAQAAKLLRKYMPKMTFIGHNLKFEYKMFKVNYNIDINIAHCTMLGEYIIDERLKYRYNLGDSVKEHFPEIPSWKESKDFMRRIMWLPPSRVGKYCARDCAYTYLLYLVQKTYITKYLNRVFYEIELPYIKCAAEAELHGFELDADYIEELNATLKKQQEDLTKGIYSIAKHPFDVASPQQLQKVLYSELNLPVIKTTKTGISTDKETLATLIDKTQHPILQKVLDYRLYSKLLSTYTTSYLEKINPITGRIHPSFMLTTTVTGRISCVDPNLQNIPKNASSLIRRMFLAPKDHVLLFADYSGQEVRVLAALSRDLNLIRAYNPCFKCPDAESNCPRKQGKTKLPPKCHEQDIHSLVASIIFEEELRGIPIWKIKDHEDKAVTKCRSLAKAVTFGLCYGSSAMGIASKNGMTLEEAEELIARYFRMFPGVKAAIKRIHEYALTHGNIIDMAGRYRRFKYLGMEPDKNAADNPFWKEPELLEDGGIKGIKKGCYGKVSSELRQAQNFPMQGTAASMTKEASTHLRRRYEAIKTRPMIVGFIHDEVVSCCLDTPEIVLASVEAIKKAMIEDIKLVENYGFPEELPIGVSIDVGYAWGKSMTVDSYLQLKEAENAKVS